MKLAANRELTYTDIAKRMGGGRTKNACADRVRALRRGSEPWRAWSKVEREVLISLRGTGMSFENIANIIERSAGACETQYYRHHPGYHTPRFWTKDDENTLIRMILDECSVGEIAARLGRTPGAVKGRIYGLGLPIIRK
jgi:hypothetical protein